MNRELGGKWENAGDISSFSYVCGFCNNHVGPSRGYRSLGKDGNNARLYGRIYICPTCNYPSFFNHTTKEQTPGPSFGSPISFLPPEIEGLYTESRNCISVNAFTSSVLSCRKLLMNIAVSKGADEGKSFAFYVQYLDENHYTPPNSTAWVDHIRKKGNEATHEIKNMSSDDAIELLEFTEHLLRFVYELPGKMSKYTTT